MTDRIVTGANGRKYITREPLLHPPKQEQNEPAVQVEKWINECQIVVHAMYGKSVKAGDLLYSTPQQHAWAKLIRGVRVEGETVVISVIGGNDAARELCGALIDETVNAKR